MKKFKLFAAVAAAFTLGFSSCNNENEMIGTLANEGSVTISLSGMKSNVETRAIDDAANGLTTTFSTGQLAFVNGTTITAVYTIGATHNLAAYQVGITNLTQAAGVTFENVKATKVYVIGNNVNNFFVKDANINTALSSNQLAVTSLKDGKFATAVLFGSSDVIASATTANPFGPSDYWSKVDVRPIASRIEIGKISDKNTNKFELVGVWINNYYKNLTLVSGFNATTPNTSANIQCWMNNADLTTQYTGSESTFHQLINSASVNSAVAPGGKVWAFNMFPAQGEANLPHILLHFKNITDAAGASLGRNANVYATISKYNGTTEFKAGHIYTISDLKWDAANNGGDKIEEDLISCDVKVQVVQWVAEALDPQVN